MRANLFMYKITRNFIIVKLDYSLVKQQYFFIIFHLSPESMPRTYQNILYQSVSQIGSVF